MSDADDFLKKIKEIEKKQADAKARQGRIERAKHARIAKHAKDKKGKKDGKFSVRNPLYRGLHRMGIRSRLQTVGEEII